LVSHPEQADFLQKAVQGKKRLLFAKKYPRDFTSERVSSPEQRITLSLIQKEKM